MPKAQPTSETNTTKQAILRMSSAVEDAPYALDSIKVLDVETIASCGGDFDIARAASCGPVSPKSAASCGAE